MKNLSDLVRPLQHTAAFTALPAIALNGNPGQQPGNAPIPFLFAAPHWRLVKAYLQAKTGWFTGLSRMRTLAVTGLLLLLTASLPLIAQPAIQWDKTLGGTEDETLASVHQTSDGGYILGGRSYSGISGDKTADRRGPCNQTWPFYCDSDYWVVKLDAAGNKQWDKTFGGSELDYLEALQQTSDGGYILGGRSESPVSGDKTEASKGDYDFWVIKLDAAGNKLWDKTIGGSVYDELASLQQTSDGGYILGGFSNSGISDDKTAANIGGADFWIVKLDAAGNKVWDKTLGGTAQDRLRSLQQTSEGGYILGGTSDSPVGGDKTQASRGGADYWVLKLDAAGNKQWDKTFGSSGHDQLTSLQQTSDGGYIVGGNSSSPGTSGDKTTYFPDCDPGGVLSSDVWVVKLDAGGNKQWDQTYGHCESYEWGLDYLSDISQTADGGYLMGASISSTLKGPGALDHVYFDYWIVKLSALGNQEWEKTIGGKYDDFLADVELTGDGSFILGGSSESPASGDKTGDSKQVCVDDPGDDSDVNCLFDFWVVKLAPFPVGQQVTGYTLINANNEQPIRTITNGEVINLTTLPSRNLNIRIHTNPAVVGSVSYALTGTVRRVKWDNTAPFSLFGDDAGNYNKWITPVGSYTLTATPYSGADKTGTAGTPRTINFTVIDQAPGQYTLTITPTTNGTVSKIPDQASYAEGSTVQLTASPAPGYVFSGWTGDASGTTNPLSVVMNSNKTIGASFTAVPAGQQVTGFTLINTNNETVIQPITNGQVLNLATLPSRNLNIRIDTNPAVVGSVGYALTGTVRRVKWDNTAPYSLFGDDAGNYNKWVTPVGSYTLTATPYSGADKTGTAGTPLTISFSVIDQATTAARLALQPDRIGLARQLTLYPNPTDGRLQVRLAEQLQGSIRYSLLSSAGTKLAAGTLNLESPTGLLDFDFSRQLPAAGLYYLKLEGAKGQQTFKILRR